jgi:hypothetical protein
MASPFDGKSNQNRSRQEGFSAAQALPSKSGKTLAAIFLHRYPIALLPCMQKVAMPFQRFWPPLFCLISPEAFLPGKALLLLF